METLTELELTLLQGLTTKYPSLLSHISALKVTERKTTNSGMTVHFSYVNFDRKLDEINALFSNGENIEIKNLKQGLGYVIDVSDGQIMYIEFSTYGENWNGILGDYKIVEKN